MPGPKKIKSGPDIGNSFGLQLPKEIEKTLNLDRNTWAAQFKAAIEAGHEPERDMFEGMGTEFDKTECSWDEK